MESKGVASDQINGGSLMRFVKQHRSRSLGVQSRLSNLGLQGDRYYWSTVLLWKKNPPFVPLIPEVQLFHSSLPCLRLHVFYTQKIHSPTHTSAIHPERISPISVLFVLCPFTQAAPQSLSSCHLSFSPKILIAGLHLTLYSSCLWASEPLCPPTSHFAFSPVALRFIMSLLGRYDCLHHALQGVSMSFNPTLTLTLTHHGHMGQISRNTFASSRKLLSWHKVILISFFLSGHTVPVSSFARLRQGNFPVWSKRHCSGTRRRQAETGHISFPQFR